MSALLQISDLGVSYDDVPALSAVSLEVAKGEIVAIVGSNGAGKSTLIRTVAGIQRARSGRIVFRGCDITAFDSHEICNLGIGQVAEGRQLFPNLTVLENLRLGATAAGVKSFVGSFVGFSPHDRENLRRSSSLPRFRDTPNPLCRSFRSRTVRLSPGASDRIAP